MQVSLLFEQSVLNRIEIEANQRQPFESGGLLLGYRKPMGLHIVDVTVPFPLDQMQKYLFAREDPLHQSYATKRWKESGGRFDWLGEWHSHPEEIPHPSGIDLKSWTTQGRGRELEQAYLIQGYRKPRIWHLGCDVLTRELFPIASDPTSRLFENSTA